MDNNFICFSFVLKIMHTMFVFLSCEAIVYWNEFDFSEEESDGHVVPNRHNRRVYNEEALQLSLGSGRYPEFLGIEGPQNPMDPHVNNAMD